MCIRDSYTIGQRKGIKISNPDPLYVVDIRAQDNSIVVGTQDFLNIKKLFLEKLIFDFNIEIIFHAAAYKHVPLVEENICEGVKNNVFSTLAVVKAAVNKKVSSLVLISSDKAVRPTNIMGASKRLAELCMQGIYESTKDISTNFSIVRFGNVLESSGSVIPKFRKQIKEGGPITLTHKDVTRYFMTVTEAAQLVIQAGSMGKNSEVFVLDMGESVKIKDLIFASTGVIGEEFPVEKIRERLPDLVDRLRAEHNKMFWIKMASAIMTTDTKPKLAYEEIIVGDELIKICGIAKGSGTVSYTHLTLPTICSV